MSSIKADGRSPEPLHAFVDAFKRLGRDEFTKAHGDCFLLLDTGTLRGPQGTAGTTFEPRPAGADDEATAPTTFEVLALRPRGGEGVVRVGRAEECDVVINDQSVSSVHAVFEQRSDGARTLRDNGSKNGTFVDERLVAGPGRGEPLVLGSRHAVRFGSLSTVFLDVDGFREVAKLFDPEVK